VYCTYKIEFALDIRWITISDSQEQRLSTVMSGPSLSGKMLDIQNMPRHQAFSYLLQLLNGLILLASISLLIYSAVRSSKFRHLIHMRQI
jgi:hypothetical protein